ncbi:MAG: hypothetical protein WEG36_01200 [Gemmatimonadota bacterium]
MSTYGRSRIIAAMFGFALSILPAVAYAQSPAQAAVEANRLHAQAEALANAASADIGKALPAVARLHGEALALRQSGDPRHAECTEFQASLLFLIGDYEQAQGLMEWAAWLRISEEEYVEAAVDYVAAAEAAQVQGRPEETVRLAKQVARIPEAHRLTPEDRAAIYTLVN